MCGPAKAEGGYQGKGRRGVSLTILSSFYQAEDGGRVFQADGITCKSPGSKAAKRQKF